MKVCDLCGSLEIFIEDGDVHLCKKCKETLDKSEEDARQGRIKKFNNVDDMIEELN